MSGDNGHKYISDDPRHDLNQNHAELSSFFSFLRELRHDVEVLIDAREEEAIINAAWRVGLTYKEMQNPAHSEAVRLMHRFTSAYRLANIRLAIAANIDPLIEWEGLLSASYHDLVVDQFLLNRWWDLNEIIGLDSDCPLQNASVDYQESVWQLAQSFCDSRGRLKAWNAAWPSGKSIGELSLRMNIEAAMAESLVDEVCTALCEFDKSKLSGCAPPAAQTVPPEFRSEAMTTGAAAPLLGYGRGESAAKSVKRAIDRKQLRCDKVGDRKYVFDIRQFRRK